MKVQIPKSLFNLVKSIFDEHDMDGDRQIDENEFIEAVGRADEKSAEQEAARIKERYFDQQVGGTIAAMAEKRRLLGSEARRRHARGMFHSVTSKKSTHEQHITLLDWVSMFFPHLPRSAVKKACDKYAPEQPPTVVKKKTLNDINGAKEEIGDMFLGLDADRDGLVRIKSLEPRMLSLGISKTDIQDWLGDLPPVLCRKKAGTLHEPSMSRVKSKLTLQDMECLLGPVYLTPNKSSNLKDIQKQIEFSTDVACDAIYGTI